MRMPQRNAADRSRYIPHTRSYLHYDLTDVMVGGDEEDGSYLGLVLIGISDLIEFCTAQHNCCCRLLLTFPEDSPMRLSAQIGTCDMSGG